MEIWDISHNRTSLQRRLFVIERSSHFFLPGATRHSFISVNARGGPSGSRDAGLIVCPSQTGHRQHT
ncbi:uncharacterized protein LOC112552946 isoform X3 [Pogonomyrmex barbatus]|uniref:Uncharacterized protein LOC112552946 isoform X3 n=1 Tax=Pogonomyrmex barbatus TaxID=144034 RepID=A0A8N1SBC3_9HYME|nr:uncharacterized protein LOC112552946 isoform X3 [Pogonomyrmex barbatus]